jgi:hypothetical protein
MQLRTKILFILFILFLWVFYRSGTLERKDTVIPSNVPGVPDRGSVEYRLNWGNFSGYVRSLIPR